MSASGRRWFAALTAICVLAAALVVGMSARHWVGNPFPGFLVLSNRVIPSVSGPGWLANQPQTLFQSAVVAVDGRPVTGARQIYDYVRRQPLGTSIEYALQRGSDTHLVSVRSHEFSRLDYASIFGAYLVTAVLYFAMALLAAIAMPRGPLSSSLFALGISGGVFALSGARIYDLDLLAGRLHFASESLLAAALCQLAVVVGARDETASRVGSGLAWWWGVSLAALGQFAILQPVAYSTVHAANEFTMGVGGALLIGALLRASARASGASPTLRGALVGAIAGLGLPATLMALSGVSGGVLPVNLVAYTAFLFPLCVSQGILRALLGAGRPAAVAMSEAT